MPFLPLPLPFCRFVDFLPLPLNMVHFVPSNPVRTLYYYPSVLPPKPVSWCCFGIYLTGVPVAGSASWWPGQHSLSLRCDSGEQQQQRWRHATGTIIKPIVEKHAHFLGRTRTRARALPQPLPAGRIMVILQYNIAYCIIKGEREKTRATCHYSTASWPVAHQSFCCVTSSACTR